MIVHLFVDQFVLRVVEAANDVARPILDLSIPIPGSLLLEITIFMTIALPDFDILAGVVAI